LFYEFFSGIILKKSLKELNHMEEIKNVNEHQEWNHIDKVATGKNIRKLCEERGVSRKFLAAVLGLTSVQAVDHYFSGKNLPSVESLVIMGALFNNSIEDVLVLQGDAHGLIRNCIIEIDDEANTVNNTLFIKSSKTGPINTFEQLGDIWYDIPEIAREDIKNRIFDCLLSGNSHKDVYILKQFEKAYEYSKMHELKE
jgi:transcriptional regulator with XRE-family HTH domain